MINIYNNSMLKDWQICKQKYYLKYIKKIVIPKTEQNFELGKKVHALISYKLNGFDMNLMEKISDEEVLKHYKSILNYKLLKQTPFLTEWGFCVNIANTKNLFVGRIDAVFFDNITGKYTIADWKTGMQIPKNPILDLQAQIYLYAFYKARKDLKINVCAENIIFTFVRTPNLEEKSIEFSQELYVQFEENFLKTIKEIKSFVPPNAIQMQNKCCFCEYKFICEKNTRNN